MPDITVALLPVYLGLVHGFLNGAAMREGAGTLGLLGIMSLIFIAVALASAFVVSLSRLWMRIAVRVAGSWICASGILMLGWSLRAG